MKKEDKVLIVLAALILILIFYKFSYKKSTFWPGQNGAGRYMTFEYIGTDIPLATWTTSGDAVAGTNAESTTARYTLNTGIWAGTSIPAGFSGTCWGIRKELRVGGGGPIWYLKVDPTSTPGGTPPIQIDTVTIASVAYAIPQYVLIKKSLYSPVLQCNSNATSSSGADPATCDCNAGYYGTGDDNAVPGTSGCTQCQEGYYCTGAVAQSTPGTAVAVACPSPVNYSVAMSSTSNACGLKCVASTSDGCGTSTSATTSSAAVCKCGAGYSFVVGNSSVPAPGGGLFQQNTCTTCASGSFQPNSVTGATTCTLCAVGNYNLVVKQTSCSACGAGKETNLAGSGSYQCNTCGTYKTASGSANASGSCVNCPVGQYAADSSSACSNCPTGQDSLATNSAYGTGACTNCPANKFSTGNGTSCSACPAGSASAAGASACVAYASSSALNTYLGGTSGSGVCAAGTYGIGGGSCSACGAGTYSAAGASSCTNCNPGQYSAGGATTCSTCSAGQYSVIPGSLCYTVSKVAAGLYHSVALLSNGTLMAWGTNSYGQLGDGTTTQRTKPVAVTGLTGITITAIACGDTHTVALASTGAVYTWGRNNYGQLGDGTNTDRTTGPVALTGTLSSSVTAIAAASGFTIALKGGAVYGTGLNSSGQLGIGSTTNSNSAVGATGNMASSITAISCGDGFTIALASSGAMYGTGLNSSGQLGTGNTNNATSAVGAASPLNSGVTAIACGGAHTIALKTNSVYGTGLNSAGQLGTGNFNSSNFGVAAGGTMVSGVTAIACGDAHTIALKGGAVHVTGGNIYGQLANGNTTNVNTPVGLTGTLSSGISSIAGGTSFTIVCGSGGVYAAGYGLSGQLGDGTGVNRSAGAVSIVNT